MKTTCAVDVKKDSLEVEVIEWDENDQPGKISKRTIEGDQWGKLNEIIKPIDMTFIDAGFRTEEVYQFTVACHGPAYPMFGRSGPSNGKTVVERTKPGVGDYILICVDEYRAGKDCENLSDLRVYNMAALDYLNAGHKAITNQIDDGLTPTQRAIDSILYTCGVIDPKREVEVVLLVERLVEEIAESTIVSCVYCAHEYPEGTPATKAQALTDHIKACEQHPMREAEKTIVLLRGALVGVVGSDDREELEKIEGMIRLAPAPDEDKASTINAIHVIIKTMDRGKG